MSVELLPHQKEAMEQTKGMKNIAVYHDMGLGKTYTGSEMMFRFKTRVNLIVCQKSKVDDWLEHLRLYYSYIPDFAYDLTKKQGLQDFLEHVDAGEETENCYGVINYELAWRRKELLKLQNFTLMLDESSLIQNTSAKQTKFILKLTPSHVILLSGTPVGGKYENLWSQLHLMGWGISEKLFEKQYVNWKTIDAGGIKHKVVDKENPYKNTDRLKRKMSENGAIFKKTEECFNLPEKNFQIVWIKPTKDYWKFQRDSYIEEDGKQLLGDTTLTKMLYERQLCGQYNQEKLEAVKDLMESTQDRLIIFYNFNEEREKLIQLCIDLGRPFSEINGHVKDLKAYADESNSVTLCQYQSASKGLNLQKCNRIIYFTLPLSSEDYEQSKKRIHRIGQDKPCFYYLLICRSSIEKDILKTLQERKDYTDELFRKG